MANLTTAISVQIDSKDKEQVTEILQKLGVSMSGLINMTIKQVIMRGGIPFEIELPREEYDLYNFFTEEELYNVVKELDYIKNHLDEYKKNNKWEDLKLELSNEKI